jgi:hypothetical protein
MRTEKSDYMAGETEEARRLYQRVLVAWRHADAEVREGKKKWKAMSDER